MKQSRLQSQIYAWINTFLLLSSRQKLGQTDQNQVLNTDITIIADIQELVVAEE